MAVKGSKRQDVTLTRYSQLRQENCANRLHEIVASGTSNPSQNWILTSCQVCPNCHVIARREDGCNHIVCRCGCHFCFGCGVPHNVLDHLNAPGHAYRCSCTEASGEQASLGQWLGSLKALPPALSSLEICLLDLSISRDADVWRRDIGFLLNEILDLEAIWDEAVEYSLYGAAPLFGRAYVKKELAHSRHVRRLRADKRQQRAADKKARKLLNRTPPRGGRHKMTCVDFSSMI